MIKNERQYRITKAQADRFKEALRQFTEVEDGGQGIHPKLRKAQEDAMRSQLADLEAELEAYEALRSGQRKVPPLDSFDDLPRALIEARIAAGLTQKELAERLGLKEQQIQRYEATEYASASFARIRQVVQALGTQAKKRAVLAR